MEKKHFTIHAGNSGTIAQWVLRIAVAGEFLGHGGFAILGKADWVNWIVQLAKVDHATADMLLKLIGVSDIIVAFVVLVQPMPFILLWAAFWGFFTALVRPMVGLPMLDFIERWANWGAPLALLLLVGWPKKFRDWFGF